LVGLIKGVSQIGIVGEEILIELAVLMFGQLKVPDLPCRI
jgi:hypothetical protein